MLPSLDLHEELNYTMTGLLPVSAIQEDAISWLLRAACEGRQWQIGAIWVLNPILNALYCVGLWSAAGTDPSPFAELTRQRPCLPGEGVPGRVLLHGESAWVDDLSAHDRLPRTVAAIGVGLRSALGVPIRLRGEVVGVLELLSREPERPEPDQVRRLSAIGTELGFLVERTHALEALRESEMRFRTLAETASDAIVTIDAAGTIVFVNPAAEQIFGYRRADLIGEDLSVLMPLSMQERHRSGFSRYQASGQRQMSWKGVELPGRHRDGHEIPLEISFGEFSSNGQRYFTGIVRDISERKQTERALRLVENIREAIAGGAPMSPAIERRVIAALGQSPSAERGEYALTPHEMRVLRLFVEGHNYKTAAAELNVSIHAVSFHLRSIYDKLQVHSKTEAVAKALQNRLV